MNTARFSVESISILREARSQFHGVKNQEGAIGLVMGLTMIAELLKAIAERAVSIDDPELLAICEQLCIVKRVGTS